MKLSSLTFAFRSPQYPILCRIGSHLVSARNDDELVTKLCEFDLDAEGQYNGVDASAEGWTQWADRGILAPAFPGRPWTKRNIIDLFNSSENAAITKIEYPSDGLSNKRVQRVVAEIAEFVS